MEHKNQIMTNKVKNICYIFAILLFCIFLSACRKPHNHHHTTIAISKSYESYVNWLKSFDSTLIILDMYSIGIDSAIKTLNNCDGLLITGGNDIYPAWYGEEYDSARCDPPDMFRDTLEMKLLEEAIDKKIPVLGICRGLQMINVYFGGSLYFDLPTDLGDHISHRLDDTYECLHEVIIEDDSPFFTLFGQETSNSNHHQGIKILGEHLIVIGRTEDSLVESITLKNNTKQFLLGVQWHPERMGFSKPLSKEVAEVFLAEIK